ncbi:MAG TPA: type II CRISPR-associated endonuclease Cas1 [Azospirillum sp.]
MLIEIRSPGCHVHVVNGILEVVPGRTGREAGQSPFRIPPADVTGFVVEAPQTTLTSAALVALAEEGVRVVLCDDRHRPALEVQRADGAGSAQAAALLKAQILLRSDTRKRLWREVAKAKIRLQAETLDVLACGNGTTRLRRLAEAIRPGDPDNREAAAAQVYWTALMGREFRRDAAECPTNARLNYGYAILRSVMLRALHGAGLHPSFGLHHSNRDNPGSLADDLMEPYRPAVDRLVHFIGIENTDQELTPACKRHLAELPGYPVLLNGQWMRLANAVAETCRSHVAVLRRETKVLALPHMLGRPEQCPTPGAPCG